MEGIGLSIALWLGLPLCVFSLGGVLWGTFWYFAGLSK